MAEAITLRIPFDKFMSFQTVNQTAPKEILSKLCSGSSRRLNIRQPLVNSCLDIVTNIINGNDPNDVVILNSVRECINKINQANFDDVSERLMAIDYSSESHMVLLVKEVLTAVMNDMAAIKGIDVADIKTVSYTIHKLVERFSCVFVKTNDDKEVYFTKIFNSFVNSIWEDFINIAKPLDRNNQHRVDNYKGFCNFIGLLSKYDNPVFTGSILDYIEDLAETIFNPENMFISPEVECLNLFHGYRVMLGHYLDYVENTKDKKDLERANTIHASMFEGYEKTKRLRKMSMIHCKNIRARLEKLVE